MNDIVDKGKEKVDGGKRDEENSETGSDTDEEDERLEKADMDKELSELFNRRGGSYKGISKEEVSWLLETLVNMGQKN